jgi:hypothetical protein
MAFNPDVGLRAVTFNTVFCRMPIESGLWPQVTWFHFLSLKSSLQEDREDIFSSFGRSAGLWYWPRALLDLKMTNA